MSLPDAVDEIEDVQKGFGDRHGTIDILTALLQAAEGESLALEVDAVGRELQCFRDVAARVEEYQAERADHAGGIVGGLAERVAFAGGKVEAVPLGVVETHGGRGHVRDSFCRRSAGTASVYTILHA